MKSVVVMLDGGYVLKRLYALLGKRHPQPADVIAFAEGCVDSTRQELFRIYYYDCPPCSDVVTHPMSGARTDLGRSAVARRITKLQESLATADHAFRRGEIKFRGWRLTWQAYTDLTTSTRSCAASDFEYDLKQKGVGMRIGLDIAWLAS